MGTTLPVNPSTQTAATGNDYLVYVETIVDSVSTWQLIGGQKDATFNDEYEEIDASHKTSGGFKSTILGLRDWSIDLESLVLLNDAGVKAIWDAYNNRKEVHVKFKEMPSNRSMIGWAYITKRPIAAATGDVASMSLTFKGNGELTDWVEDITVTPLSATVSKASATDKTFAITPSTTTISSIANGATALTVTTNYTYSSGTLVIKGTYLGSLTVGTNTLTITTGDGAKITITLTITA